MVNILFPRAIISVVLLTLLCATAHARARWPRLHLEYLDKSVCVTEQQVTAHVAYLELKGTLKAAAPEKFRLEMDGKVLEQAPVKHTTIKGRGVPLQLALVVQVSQPYAAALPQVRNGARALLRALPQGSVVTLIAYDSKVHPLASGVSVTEALDAVAGLKEGSREQDLPSLMEALEMGVRRLSLKPQPARRVLVVVSDGLNVSMQRQPFIMLGDRAMKHDISIFPVGFSPADERGPLLNLGEIAKRSVGMFRWARGAEELEGQLKRVARGITEQLLLTFSVEDGCEAPHSLRVALGPARSTSAWSTAAMEPLTGWPAVRLSLRKELGPSWATVAVVLAVALALLLLGVPLAIFLAVRRARGDKPGEPAAQPPMEQAPGPAPDDARYLLVQEGSARDGVWKEIPPGRSRVGAAPDCLRLRLDSRQGVAAHHVEVLLVEGVLTIKDLGPGLLINDRPAREASLMDGDLLQLGQARLRVRRV